MNGILRGLSNPLLRLNERILAWNSRWPWLVPLASFVTGAGSYILVQRGAWMARGVAAMAVACGLWLLLERPLASLLQRWTNGRISPVTLTYVSQGFQQEILFFSMPFLIGATRPDVGQIAFTALAGLAALITTLDHQYQWLLRRPILRYLFHAWCCLIAALVGLPLIAGLRVESALPIAMAIAGLWLLVSLPVMWSGLVTRRAQFGCIAVLLIAPALSWSLRSHVPPAGLVMRDSRVALSIDGLVPGDEVREVTTAQLGDGVVAFAAVQAPDGLAQQVSFDWYHNGECVDQIPMFIHGTGKGGWRTFTRKYNFGDRPEGKWRVDVRTPQGQLLARMRFRVDA